MARHATITVTKDHARRRGLNLSSFPSAGPRPNITGMKNLYWGKDARCIKCGLYVYKVDQSTYEKA